MGVVISIRPVGAGFISARSCTLYTGMKGGYIDCFLTTGLAHEAGSV